MLIFSNCKINLGLRILRKRTDGYHDLETVFYPIPFNDVIEVIRTGEQVQFSSSGIPIDVEPAQNLCMKAYALLKGLYELPPFKLHLHKSIPSGAGLGGGSANAAFTLKLLNAKFNLGLNTTQLLDLALQLGSDCPFFIVNKPCLATGRGELFESIDLSRLKGYKLVLVNPGIHISTAWAFSRVRITGSSASIKDLVSQPLENWKHTLVNDFEEAVFSEYPVIAQLKNELYSRGAIYASMSGSGSTVFGIFESVGELNLPGMKVMELNGD